MDNTSSRKHLLFSIPSLARMNLQLWNRNSTDKARNLIRTLLAANSTALSTQQIYKLVVKTESPESAHEHGEHHHGILPPHPKNVIRSMRYVPSFI